MSNLSQNTWEEVEVLHCTSTSVTPVADSLGLFVLFVLLKTNAYFTFKYSP